ncbi:hypothetical protein [Actibacterium atlanticum]|nr:hypothetical protein [Actibacterium atlanticum]
MSNQTGHFEGETVISGKASVDKRSLWGLLTVLITSSLISAANCLAAEPIQTTDHAPLWTIQCLDEGALCLATSSIMVVFLDSNARPHLALKNTAPERLSVLNGRLSKDLPHRPSEPLAGSDIRLLSQDGAHLVVQRQGEPLLLLQTWGLDTAVNEIRQRSGRSLQTDSAVAQENAPPVLQRFEEIQKFHEAPPVIFLPAIKPQAQMSIRAQNGLVLPIISGMGQHIEQYATTSPTLE